MISVKNLKKVYQDDGSETQALRGVSFEIQKGEFVAIMGPSGSGKSTLLHILGFLDRPTSGSYSFMGKVMEELNDLELAEIRNDEMGFIFQDFNLLGKLSVYENVELPLLYNDNISPHERKREVEKAVESVGLSEKIGVVAGNLSGGQKQRVAIARALVNNPNVIFADEPTGNLDSRSGGQVMEILRRLNDGGHTVILVTHETYTAEFAERLIRLKDGEIESDVPVHNRRKIDDFFK
ncbi:ABC transporter ATP-binding protein [Patescibacteria group bacterium]|nr:ABC transporter ATP-binding protein [Patescibacteria group bacterium]MCL5114439.1 ABC transporter ATP-binding protein [Patescibacteria group bacterium]